MTFADLLAFVTERMRMSHIYQPLLIRAQRVGHERHLAVAPCSLREA